MTRLIKNGITYSRDAASLALALTNGSRTISQDLGKLETKASYVRGDVNNPSVPVEGTFMIFSGTADPTTDSTLAAIGKNGDIYLKRIS